MFVFCVLSTEYRRSTRPIQKDRRCYAQSASPKQLLAFSRVLLQESGTRKKDFLILPKVLSSLGGGDVKQRSRRNWSIEEALGFLLVQTEDSFGVTVKYGRHCNKRLTVQKEGIGQFCIPVASRHKYKGQQYVILAKYFIAVWIRNCHLGLYILIKYTLSSY